MSKEEMLVLSLPPPPPVPPLSPLPPSKRPSSAPDIVNANDAGSQANVSRLRGSPSGVCKTGGRIVATLTRSGSVETENSIELSSASLVAFLTALFFFFLCADDTITGGLDTSTRLCGQLGIMDLIEVEEEEGVVELMFI
jgi:hypothetical protein